MPLHEVASLDFSAEGGGLVSPGEGWSSPEPGRRWTEGTQSALAMNGTPGCDHVLMLVVEPFAGIPELPHQRLTIFAGGEPLRAATLTQRTILACRVPRRLLGEGGALTFRFEHPDAARPSELFGSTDQRSLAIAFFGATLFRLDEDGPLPTAAEAVDPAAAPDAASLSDGEIMLRFASLGDNCEFGIAQRFAGVEPLGLLRFANANLASLARALDDDFRGIDDANALEIEIRETLIDRREYITCNRHYDIETHAHVFENEMPAGRMFAREVKRLGLLRRMLIDDLRGGRRVFVYKQNDAPALDAVRALSRKLRAIGPNTLLFVTRDGETGLASGDVSRVEDGLLVARIDRFSPYDDAASRPSDLWPAICRKAYALWRDP